MKKVLVLVLTLLMIGTFGIAEEYDFSSMSLDELSNVWKELCDEIDSRFEPINASIYPGTYIVGKDIIEGQYVFTCLKSEYSAHVITFETEEKYMSYFNTNRYSTGDERNAIEQNAISRQTLDVDETCYLNLRAGMVLMIKDGEGFLNTTTTSWAP